MTNFNAEITNKEHASDVSVEILESLSLGAMFYEPTEDPSIVGNFHNWIHGVNLLPAWMEKHQYSREHIGLAYCMNVEHVLMIINPTPETRGSDTCGRLSALRQGSK